LIVAVLDTVKFILKHQLQLGDRTDDFGMDTPLLGSLPEFDSMAVVGVLTAIEEEFGVVVEDDEISAEVFESVGSLAHFIEGLVE